MFCISRQTWATDNMPPGGGSQVNEQQVSRDGRGQSTLRAAPGRSTSDVPTVNSAAIGRTVRRMVNDGSA